MATPKKYFHDHLVLLLLSTNVFLTLLTAVVILLRLSGTHSNSYIVQCRDCSNQAAINKFQSGSVIDLLSFIIFALLVLVADVMLSLRTYRIHRQVAIAILGMGLLLIGLTIIVSNALLVLR